MAHTLTYNKKWSGLAISMPVATENVSGKLDMTVCCVEYLHYDPLETS